MDGSAQTKGTDFEHDDAAVMTLRLAMLSGIGPRTLTALIETFGTPDAVLSAGESELAAVPGVGPKMIHTIRTASHHVDTDSIIQWCRDNDCALLRKGGTGYPKPLEDLHDAPPILFSRGAMTETDGLAVAIVGTRHATAYGTRQADRMAYGLAKAGVTVISGLARGIDAAASCNRETLGEYLQFC